MQATSRWDLYQNGRQATAKSKDVVVLCGYAVVYFGWIGLPGGYELETCRSSRKRDSFVFQVATARWRYIGE